VTVTKKIMATVALCTLSLAGFAETKIAIVNPTAAMQGTAVAKAKIEKLEKRADYAATKAKLDGVIADIKALQAAYQKENATWTTEKKEESEKKLQSLKQDYQFNGKKIQDEQQALSQEISQELGPKVAAAIKYVVEAEKINLVIDSQTVYHATPDQDITLKVTEQLNKAK
jgi:outer membrane protein